MIAFMDHDLEKLVFDCIRCKVCGEHFMVWTEGGLDYSNLVLRREKPTCRELVVERVLRS